MIEDGKIVLRTEAWLENGEWHFSIYGPRWLLEDIDQHMVRHARHDQILMGLRATGGPVVLVGAGERQHTSFTFATESLKPKYTTGDE